MKPINEKERTVAFVQFLVLFILTIILAVFFVFFDIKVKGKDYEAVKTERDILKSSHFASSDLPHKIDSIKELINSLEALNEQQFKDKKEAILSDDFMRSKSNDDTTTIGKLNVSVIDVFKSWLNTMYIAVNRNSLSESIKIKQSELEDLKKKHSTLQEEYDRYKLLHPN